MQSPSRTNDEPSPCRRCAAVQATWDLRESVRAYRRRRVRVIQSAAMFEILSSIPWFAWIAIVAITWSAVVAILKAMHRHDERMAMIKQGMEPPDSKDH